MNAILPPFDAAAVLITLAAAFAWINYKYLHFPTTVGLAFLGALASIAVVAADWLAPSLQLGAWVRDFLEGIDFRQALLEGMLSFLLFAGALHVDWHHLRRGGVQVAILSTLGIVVSTLIVGLGLYFLTTLAGLQIPIAWCLVFGALISPTDPVAVMGIMKSVRAPPALEATVSGESLFNDGIGVVLFSIALTAATAGHFSFVHAGEIFLVEALGGGLFGLALGWIGFRAMRSIDNYQVELLITLALVMGGYALAGAIGVSGPVAMAVCGLFIGNHGASHAMSDETRAHVIGFWSLVDEVLNAMLFLLIGLEGAALIGDGRLVALGLAAIPLVIFARAASVGPPLLFWRNMLPFRASLPVLVWGGLRGGISIALALSLPSGGVKDLIVTATYVVVLFSVLVQGATIGPVVRRSADRAPSA